MILKVLLLAALLPPGDKEAAEAIARFKKSYRSNSAPARAIAVADLARTVHRKTLLTLAPLLTSDVNTVRKAAAVGLGGFSEEKKLAVPILMAGLRGPNNKEYDVQAAIYDSLGKLGDLRALRTVQGGFKHKQAVVAGAAYKAAGKMKAISAIDLILKNLKKEEKISKRTPANQDPQIARAKKVVPDIIKAMQFMSGDKWTTAQEWQIWWKRNRIKILTGGKKK